METSQELQVKESPQSCNPVLTLGGRFSQGTTLTALAVAGVGAGLVLGWDSLVALGLSSFILAVLPCAVMCALGLCMHRMSKNEQTSGSPSVTPGTGTQAAKMDSVGGPNTIVSDSRS